MYFPYLNWPIIQHFSSDIVFAVQMLTRDLSHLTDHALVVNYYGMKFISISNRNSELHLDLSTGIQAIGSTIVHLTAAIDIRQVCGDLGIEVPQLAAIIAGYASLEQNQFS